jgi:hypothetical protein
MKKILFLICLVAFIFSSATAQKSIKLAPNVYAVEYTGVTADSISATDTAWTYDIQVNKANATFYNLKLKLTELSSPCIMTVSLMGKIYVDDDYTTIGSHQYLGAGTDTSLLFTQNTTAQFYRYYRVKVVYGDKKAKVSYFKIYFKY